jgi:hypothetical protein
MPRHPARPVLAFTNPRPPRPDSALVGGVRELERLDVHIAGVVEDLVNGWLEKLRPLHDEKGGA